MDERLGKKIGEGGCSEVFEWVDNSKIIKLGKLNTDYEGMQREYQNNYVAWESGLPVAKPVELLNIAGRPAIAFERIFGETIKERFFKQLLNQAAIPVMKSIENDVRLTARALSEIHKKTPLGSLSSQRENIKSFIQSVEYLTQEEKLKIITMLDAQPLKQLFCHGDPNPGNIIVRVDGSFAVIDWMNASIGNPEADIAEYIIMVRYAILPDSLPSAALEFFDTIRETMISIFMDEYCKETGFSSKDIEPWIVPIAARKLSADGISEDEKCLLIKDIRGYLSQLAEA
ncbi:aminoglycoside phosphotransferase family protein [Paenibacillus herberti]|uniref:Aminoglycoside phosphotransferase n=1 Tax=Paenibacillus herberti TaxID=1619309 RepID=A0A229NXH4_9BACL|nr:aminoglycoside phosphotransferase family protein [Paenibacillus herberti]OXM14632.1 aminoglycoside phosphotransferase [Paenibacillus herberti]